MTWRSRRTLRPAVVTVCALVTHWSLSPWFLRLFISSQKKTFNTCTPNQIGLVQLNENRPQTAGRSEFISRP